MFEYLEKRKVWLVYIPLFVYWLVLFTATSLPAYNLPKLGLSDKINHLVAYFLLAILLNLTLIYQRKSRFLFERAAIATFIICLLYGAVDEIHQMFVPGRFAEILDWVADGSGAILGVFLVYFLKNKLNYNLEFN
ncbi:MAG: VanZ family protein [Ignavibacteriaceae bacterium]